MKGLERHITELLLRGTVFLCFALASHGQSSYNTLYAPVTVVTSSTLQIQLQYGNWSGNFSNAISFPTGMHLAV